MSVARKSPDVIPSFELSKRMQARSAGGASFGQYAKTEQHPGHGRLDGFEDRLLGDGPV